MMKKLGLLPRTTILLLIISLTGYAAFDHYTKNNKQKLTVDQILQDHLQSRFDNGTKEPKVSLLLRDRIVTPNDSKQNTMPYIDFSVLGNDEISINSDISDTIVYTNFHTKKFAKKDIAPHKIAWFIESPKKTAGCFKFLQNKSNEAIFDKILTCYRPLLEKGHPYVYAPVEGTTATPNINIDEAIQNKEKTLSIIASKKNWCPGHKLRHQVVERFGDKIDSIVGRGYNPIKTTSEGLLNFRYSIIIENRKQDFYFSEKLIDCLLCGTVPIYWGCPSINKFFNTEGFIQFETLDELETILNNLPSDDYNKRIAIIKENFNTAHCYLRIDKYLRKELEKIGIIPNAD